VQQDKELKCLDQLISDLGGADTGTQSVGPCGLLLEHLQAARRHVLGSMHNEYGLSLTQAKESVACITDKGARTKMKGTLQSLIDSEVPKQRPPVAA